MEDSGSWNGEDTVRVNEELRVNTTFTVLFILQLAYRMVMMMMMMVMMRLQKEKIQMCSLVVARLDDWRSEGVRKRDIPRNPTMANLESCCLDPVSIEDLSSFVVLSSFFPS